MENNNDSTNGLPQNEMEVNCYSIDTVTLLSKGLNQVFEPDLKKVNQQLKELTEKQSVLIEQLHNENLKICSAKNCDDLNGMFALIKNYQTKLMNIKKDMRSLHDKNGKLKKRASRLQQYKEKERNAKMHQVQQEQDLIGKKDK
ncbi:hypothetical protein FQR65_LT09387 [Abscondita terminalis]|nr:hypothetical protein FQR65_LT09387 [Abscondita terminalis]